MIITFLFLLISQGDEVGEEINEDLDAVHHLHLVCPLNEGEEMGQVRRRRLKAGQDGARNLRKE